jgi:hypothetical protein
MVEIYWAWPKFFGHGKISGLENILDMAENIWAWAQIWAARKFFGQGRNVT